MSSLAEYRKEVRFERRLVIVGFGCIGKAVLPLLLRHVDLRAEQLAILTADSDGCEIARNYQVPLTATHLTPANFHEILAPRLGPGDFLLNLSVNVATAALVEWSQQRGVIYLDTCIEPWEGAHHDASRCVAERTNYALRETSLALRDARPDAPTAVLAHGTNPGLVSHLFKQALLTVAADTGSPCGLPSRREDWAQLACRLGIRTIQVAERDTQVDRVRKRSGEFVNTWSVPAFVGECCQPSELGWGTHELQLPPGACHHEHGCRSAIYLNRRGASMRVSLWTPQGGPAIGFLISHGESIAISDYLTLGPHASPHYRPTVFYAYRPCDDALLSLHELNERQWEIQKETRTLNEGIVEGMDEVGVLLMGHSRGAYWYGSRLSAQVARRLAPHNNATTLQVAASVLAGVVWAMENPHAGIVEAGDMDFRRVLQIASPYLGDLTGVYTDWTPVAGRGQLFDEDIDSGDPWQFRNFLVV